MSPIHRINKLLYTHLRHNLQMFSKKIKKSKSPTNMGLLDINFYPLISFVEVLEQIALKHLPELTLMLQLVAKSVFLLT